MDHVLPHNLDDQYGPGAEDAAARGDDDRTRVETQALLAALDAHILVLQAELIALTYLGPNADSPVGAGALMRTAVVVMAINNLNQRRRELAQDVGAEQAASELCHCDDWQTYMDEIIGQQVFCSIQTAGPAYTGPAFRFCPWCGKENREKDAPTTV